MAEPVTIYILQDFAREEASLMMAKSNIERRAGRMKQEDTIRLSMTWRAICYWLTGEGQYADGWCWTGMNGNTEYLVNFITEQLALNEKAWAKMGATEPPSHGLHFDDIWLQWLRVIGYRHLHHRVLELVQPGRKYDEIARYRGWQQANGFGDGLRRRA